MTASHRVSVRDLRNSGAEVLARVQVGEHLIVTRDGDPVAELSPLPRRSLSAAELVRRRRTVPRVDMAQLRHDLDTVLDASL